MKLALIFISLSTLSVLASDSVSLFNGKDLTGWKGEGYAVKDGVITCSPKGRNLTTVKQYSNYVFEFEFKLPPGGNNGLGIHYPGTGNPAYSGMEVQILDDTAKKYADLKEYQFHGGLYTLKAAKKGHLKPVGEWNKEKVTVNGPNVTVELNGTIINEANLEELAKQYPKHGGVKRRSGYICFCGHGDPVQFRGMKITEMPATPLPQLDTTGYTPLYNGKDLSGWVQDKGHAGHWQPKGKVLSYDGQSKAKDKSLWTEKSYGDFTMICDWRWSGPAHKKLKRPLLDPTTGDVKKDKKGKPITELVDELDSGIYLRGTPQIQIWDPIQWKVGSGAYVGMTTTTASVGTYNRGVHVTTVDYQLILDYVADPQGQYDLAYTFEVVPN